MSTMAEAKVNWPQLMEEALTAPGNLGQTYSRFHDYSLTNELLFLVQGYHEPMASFKRWNQLGRKIIAGQRAGQVIVPLLVKGPEPEPSEDDPQAKRERATHLIG